MDAFISPVKCWSAILTAVIWSCSATRESPLECAIRELREETGIQAEEMIEVGKVLHYRHKTYYVEFLCIKDVDKDSICLQEGETIAYKWVGGQELLEMTGKELAKQRILNFINIEN